MSGSRIAIPYYGKLHQKHIGYERIYFIVETLIDETARMSVRLGVWDYNKVKTLPEWLQTNGVGGVICTEGPESHRKKDIINAGIEIIDNKSRIARYLMKKLMI